MSKQRRRREGGKSTNSGKNLSKRNTVVMTNQAEIDEIKDAEIVEQVTEENSRKKMSMDELQTGLFLLRDAHKELSAELCKIGDESIRIHKETNETLEAQGRKIKQNSVYIDKLNEAYIDHEDRISSIESTMRHLRVADVVPAKATVEPAPAALPAPVEPAPAPTKAKLDPVVEKIVKTEKFVGKNGRTAAKGYYAVYPDNRRVGPFVEARLACQASPIGTIRAVIIWLNPDGSFAETLTPAEVAEMFL